MYPEGFDGIDNSKDFEYHITVEDNNQPLKHPIGKIALPLQPKVKKESASLVEQGIIIPVEGSTDWIMSHVVREKPDGRSHIYLYPKVLNKAIKHEYHPIPSLEGILPKLK